MMSKDLNREESPQEITERNISRIGKELIKYGNELARTNDEAFKQYNAMLKLHNERTKDSILLLNVICDEDQEHETEVLKFVQFSSTLIKERSDTFYDFQRRWKEMNDRMKENYKVDTLLTGIKKRRPLTNWKYLCEYLYDPVNQSIRLVIDPEILHSA